MNADSIQDLFNQLWGWTITDTAINFQQDTMTFQIAGHFEERVIRKELQFLDVSAYYYVKDDLTHRFDFHDREKVDYLELTTLWLVDEEDASVTVKMPHEQEWGARHSASFNVIMENWESVLFIEARQVCLDGNITSL